MSKNCFKMMKTIAVFIVVLRAADAKVGELKTYKYETSGTVYIKNDKQLFLEDFNYNGRGPDAFFYVGTELPVGHKTGTLIPHPPGSAKPLTRIDKTNITLTLPDNLETSKIKWLSLWCREYSVNFADITSFPANSASIAFQVGELQTYKYETSGTVYIKNDKELFLEDFYYNGGGPDAFFYVGAELPVGHQTGTLIPHPPGSADPLTRIDKTNITLTLPDNLETSKIKWLSVWCREYSVNFADITSFPAIRASIASFPSSGSQLNYFRLDKLLTSVLMSVLLAMAV